MVDHNDVCRDLSTLPDSGAFGGEYRLAVDLARRAAEVIFAIYGCDSTSAQAKSDGSPVTSADLAADRLIRSGIAAAYPADAILTEESEDDLSRLDARRLWIVDPLDGTAQFIARTGEFDVFIALVEDGRPIVAAAAHPPSGVVWSAVAGEGTWVWDSKVGSTPQQVSLTSAAALPSLVSSAWYGGSEAGTVLLQIARAVGAPPPAVLATGFSPRHLLASPRRYDAFLGLVPHWSQTSAREWDIAVADLLIHEAGGRLTDLRGNVHRYNKPIPYVDGGLLVSASPPLHGHLIEEVERALGPPQAVGDDETADR